jgi:hypothetical protein
MIVEEITLKPTMALLFSQKGAGLFIHNLKDMPEGSNKDFYKQVR